MDFDINDILDFIYRNLILTLIIAVVFIIIVVLIIYRLMHYNVNSNKSSYRTRNIVLAQNQAQERENIKIRQNQVKNQEDAEIMQSNEVEKVGKTTCKFCGGEITDTVALFCPLCGTKN